MEADNQNSWDVIRGELDRLDQIPGEPAFNSNTAWAKLSLRLEKKPIHRKPMVYWLAAAILFLTFSVALFNSTDPDQSSAVRIEPKQITPSIELPSDTIAVQVIADEREKPLNVATHVAKKPVRRKPTSANIQKLTIDHDVSSSVTISRKPQLPIQVPSAAIESVATDSTALAQSKPAKLKVIHNNRLNSVIYKPELSISNAPTGFPSSSGNLRFSRNASDNILQIKLSLTN